LSSCRAVQGARRDKVAPERMILDPPADADTIEFHYTKLAASVKSAGNSNLRSAAAGHRCAKAGAYA
jgi:hypothetical protein